MTTTCSESGTAQRKSGDLDFRDKVFKYPVVVGRMRGSKVDLSAFKPAHEIVSVAKQFRDALVHPSPFPDPQTKEHGKFLVAVGANRKIAEQIFSDWPLSMRSLWR